MQIAEDRSPPPSSSVSVAGRPIGGEAPCFIIAEAGVNHNGSLDLAMKLIEVAIEAGADAIKFQTFDTDALVCRSATMAEYQVRNTGKRESQYDMVRRLQLSTEDHYKLKARCDDLGIIFLSSPFDLPSVELLEAMRVPAFKIPSGEITNEPLLRRIASLGRPVILSTGMSALSEVAQAVEWLDGVGLALLHTTSLYPTPPELVNLKAMTTLSEAFGVPTGYSDHTLGPAVSLAAVALGAKVIEKHFTLDKTMTGPDHRASADPSDLRLLVASIRAVEAAMGTGTKEPMPEEEDTRRVARKSIVALRDLRAGDILRAEDLGMKRPGTGMPSTALPGVIGRRLKRPVTADTLLQPEDLS